MSDPAVGVCASGWVPLIESTLGVGLHLDLILGVRCSSGCFTFPDISQHVSPIAAASLLCCNGGAATPSNSLCACCWPAGHG